MTCLCEPLASSSAAPANAARLRHQVAVDRQGTFGVGSYWQQGSGEDLKVRLEFKWPAASAIAANLQQPLLMD